MPAWLHLEVRTKCAQIHVLLFFPQGRNNYALSQRYAAIHALHLRSKPEASSYWPFEWPTLTVEGDTEQACGPRTMLRMNNRRSTSPLQKGLDVMQSHPLRRTYFSQYQASSAALGWPWGGDCHIMHRMAAGLIHVFLRICKNFKLWIFKKCKGRIGTKIENLFSM